MAGASSCPRGLNATQLKYLAAVFMVIDHWNMFFQPLGFLWASHPLLSQLFYFIGRMAFPLFAFFTAEGLHHTRDRRKYLLRLGLFGAATELPFLLGIFTGSGSVIATFFLAAAGIFAYEHLRRPLPKWLSLIPLFLCALLAHLAPTDYGWMGVITVAAVYLAAPSFRRKVTVLALCMTIQYLLVFPSSGFPGAIVWIAAGMACLSVLLLALTYNHERGHGNKWFFYWFYPAHIILLGGLSMIL